MTMLRSIINILLLLGTLSVQAQLLEPVPAGRARYVRVSIDPTVPLKTYLQQASISGLEFSADTEIKNDLFLIGVGGYSTVSDVKDTYSYASNGAFVALGLDFNMTKSLLLSDRDILFCGLRYGYSLNTHTVSDIVISNPWGDYHTQLPSETLGSGWVELVLGVKAEIAKNIFIGWTGEAKFLAHTQKGASTPYYISGYGRYDSESSFNFDVNFFVSYAFTFKAKENVVQEMIK